jgi:hypothetical protein
VFGDQSFDGSPSPNARAQIVSIKPQYKNTGREYLVKAASYEAVALDGTEFVIVGTVGNGLNLFVHAGNPPELVTLTFVFDAATIRSGSINTASIIAGNFAAGSKIIIILANTTDAQSKGGNGGGISLGPSNGLDGGTVYDAQGIDTDIYLGGATPSTAFPVASGFLRAPGGGGGSGGLFGFINNTGGGGGGAGFDPGDGGISFPVSVGSPGNTTGNGGSGGALEGFGGGGDGGDWGIAGIDGQDLGSGTGGAAGKGVVSGGATVTMFGDTPVNFINGSGDAVS